MDYVVIARKYRPQTFSEVVGQEAIARTLSNAIRKQRLAHGYLLTGPSGVGKTTMARILAKALSCVEGPTDTPCGVCDNCRMIADSRHPDVVEIDAATHNGVDDVREISEGAGFSPTMSRFRIYIMDEVHMLSKPAWNALLKILEEPPAHVFFIFATTEIDKVPATVVNRCQRYDFRSIGLDDIVKRLRDVCAGEGAELSDQLLHRIARAAGGGMRDAQTLLDQLLAIADGSVDEEDLNQLLGAARAGDVAELAQQLLAGNRAEAFAVIDRLTTSGVAPATLNEQLLDLFRQMMLISVCGPEHPAVTRLGQVDDTITGLARQAGQEKALRICQLILGAQKGMRLGVDPRLQLEMTLTRIASLGEVQDIDALLRRIQRLEGSGAPARGPR